MLASGSRGRGGRLKIDVLLDKAVPSGMAPIPERSWGATALARHGDSRGAKKVTTIDVHNHIAPTGVLDLVGRDPVYGVRVVGGRWQGGHHVPFPPVDSFYDPAAKISHLDRLGISGAVVSSPPSAVLL